MRELSTLQFLFFSLRLKSTRQRMAVFASRQRRDFWGFHFISLHHTPLNSAQQRRRLTPDCLRAWVWSSHPPRNSQCTSTNSGANWCRSFLFFRMNDRTTFSLLPPLSLFFHCDGHRNHKICYTIRFLIRQSNNKYIWYTIVFTSIYLTLCL